MDITTVHQDDWFNGTMQSMSFFATNIQIITITVLSGYLQVYRWYPVWYRWMSLKFLHPRKNTNFTISWMFYPCLFYPSDNVWCFRRASMHTLFYWFHTFVDHTTKISIKVRAPRRVSASGTPNDVPNCHLDQTTTDNSSMHLHDVMDVKSFILAISQIISGKRRKGFCGKEGNPSITGYPSPWEYSPAQRQSNILVFCLFRLHIPHFYSF